MKKANLQRRLSKIFILFITLAILALTVATIATAHNRVLKRANDRFQESSRRVTTEFLSDLERYDTLLRTGRSLVLIQQEVTQKDWHDFFEAQLKTGQYGGVSSVFYIQLVPKDQKEVFESKMRQEAYFGPDFRIQSGQNSSAQEYAVAKLVYSLHDVSGVRGFDNYSTPERRETYNAAAASNKPTASVPLKLATGPTGFFMVLPVYEQSQKPKGFIGVSFRAAEFLHATLTSHDQGVAANITDITDGKPIDLLSNSNWDMFDGHYARNDTVTVGGRTWRISYKADYNQDTLRLTRNIPVLIGAIGILSTIGILLLYAIMRQKGRAN